MAFDIGVGGGKVVKVTEPTRALFASNLNGAIQYSLAHTIYKVLEVMGGAIGSFAAGFLVEFLERLEPDLVDHLKPLIEWILHIPGLPAELQELLVKMQTPTSQVEALLLTSLGTSAMSAISSSVLGSLLSPLTYWVNGLIRPNRPSPAEMHAGLWRGLIGQPQVNVWLKELGWQDEMHTAFPEILRPRLSEGALMAARHREITTPEAVLLELVHRGYNITDGQMLQKLSYRLLDEASLLRARRRDLLSITDWFHGMYHLGWNQADTATIMQMTDEIPGPGDLTRFMVRDVFNTAAVATYGYDEEFPEEYAKWMQVHGFKRDWAQAFWRAKWELPSLTVAYSMYHRNIISLPDLNYLLKVGDYPPFWRTKLIQNAYTPFTRVDVRRMYGLQILDVDGVYRSYRDIGYDDEKARALTQFTVKYEDESGGNKLDKYRGMSYNLVEQAYRKEVISLAEAVKQLQDIKMPADDVDILARLMEAKKQLDDIPDWGTEHSKDFKSIVEQAYTRRLIGRGEATAAFQALNMAPRVIEFVLAVADYNYAQAISNKAIKIIGDAYANRSIDRGQAVAQFGKLGLPATLQEQHLMEWDLDRNLRSKRLSAAQYAKAHNGGLINMAQYRDNLAGLGYPDSDIDLLVKMT